MLTFCDKFRTNNGSSNNSYSTTEAENGEFYNEWIKDFGSFYKNIHGYTSITVCVLGSIVNIFNLFVLSKKGMRNAANIILTGLAVADLLNMLEYIPFAIYMEFWPDKIDGLPRKTYPWAVFVLAHSIFSQLCHTAAICLTVALAIWRLVMATMIDGGICCTTQRARWIVALAYGSSLILCIPIFLVLSISEVANPIIPSLTINTTKITTFEAKLICKFVYSAIQTAGTKQYVVEINVESYPILEQFMFWFYSIVVKLLPCVILTIVSTFLVRSLLSLKKRKEELFGGIPLQGSPNTSVVYTSNAVPRVPQTKSLRTFVREINALTRSAKAIIAICILFLFTEFPHGLLALLSGIFGDQFFKSFYVPLSEFMDILVLVNYSVNFLLCCLMSQSYRKEIVASFIRQRAENLS